MEILITAIAVAAYAIQWGAAILAVLANNRAKATRGNATLRSVRNLPLAESMPSEHLMR
jgi:hypothetical protein